MNTLMQSQVFFFISSIGFIVLFILGAILLVYLIRTMRTFSRIIARADKDMYALGTAVKELLDDISNNPLFRFFFRKKKVKHTKNS